MGVGRVGWVGGWVGWWVRGREVGGGGGLGALLGVSRGNSDSCGHLPDPQDTE